MKRTYQTIEAKGIKRYSLLSRVDDKLNRSILKKPMRYFIMWCALLSPLFSSAQAVSPHLDTIGQKLTDAISNYYKRYPQEKIFIHTDQNVYLGGQTIWYKAYAYAYGKPSQLSKIAYVRLSGPDGRLVIQNKLPLNGSTAFGNINLPDSLHSGWYHLQGFTAWMLNFDEDGLYDKLLYLQNPRDRAVEGELPASNGRYHIAFFPEGGDMIDGNICNIAFKATDENGRPAKVYGDVLENGKVVKAKLITIHDGMGSFQMEANAAASYTAKVHFPDSSVQEIALPKIRRTGIGLRIDVLNADELEAKITYTGRQLKKDIILEAEQNNGLNVAYPLQLSLGTNIIGIKKSEFSTGILRLTIFDEEGLPDAERIVFINNNDQLKVSLDKDILSLGPKAKNVFTLKVRDCNDKAMQANLSVAVTDADLSDGPDDNICSYFLMSSELRGAINQPAWYFKNNSDTLQKQLDLVMLTNGWRHFKWDTVLNEKPFALKHAVERSQFIAGKIDGYNDADKLKIKLMIAYKDSSKFVGLIEPDSTGLFLLKDDNHQGAANLYFDALDRKKRKQPVKVTFLSAGIDTINLQAGVLGRLAGIKPYINDAFLDTLSMEQNNQSIAKMITLKAVHIWEHKLTPTQILEEKYVKRLSGDNVQTLDLINVPTLPTGGIIEYIQGRFPGLKVVPLPQGGIYFEYHGVSELLGSGNEAPYFYVDEASATLGDVRDMSLNDVALIQFAPPPTWFAPLNGGNIGAILIYTKKFGDDNNAYRTGGKAFDRYTVDGYSVTREFSSPDYSSVKQNAQPDYRTTLYWAHDLTTDDQGNIKIHFYNSDHTKRYRVIVQGMTADGKIGYLNEVF